MLDVASPPIQRCMSSLITSWRVRTKSPPLQPPSVTLIQSSARVGDKIGTCCLVRIGKHVSGIARCPEVSADDDGAEGPYLLPVRFHRWFHRRRVRSGQRVGSGWFPCL